jgi:hypothetical protein
MNQFFEQVPTLLGVVVGALASYFVAAATERRRMASVRSIVVTVARERRRGLGTCRSRVPAAAPRGGGPR